LVAGACGKIALDVTLLAQTEVGEVSAPVGGSTAMPHKRNPASAIVAVAAARQVVPHIDLLVEHERGAGTWQTEWAAITSALGYAGGAAAATRETLEGLQVNAERMRANIARELSDYPPADDTLIDRTLEWYGG
jgi:3-carboxy-cis,cis-muconate cycloisomerase